jgi:hypothetical protein
MQRLIWILTWVAVALWSGLAWATHGLLQWGGAAAAANADVIPVEPILVEWASWLALLGSDIASWLMIALWASVTLVILAIGFVGAKLAPRIGAQLKNG